MLEKTLESPLDCKEIQPVHPKGNQSWIFMGRTDAETLIPWPPDVKNWCLPTVVMEKTLESPLVCKEITPVNPKGNQSWIFLGRTDAETEAPIFWPPDAKNWLIREDPNLGKIEGGRIRGWQRLRWLDGITDSMEMSLSKLWEIVKEGQGSLACCSPWGCKQSDMPELLNNNNPPLNSQNFITTWHHT